MLDLKIFVVWKHNRVSRVNLGTRGRLFCDNIEIQNWLESYLAKNPLDFPLHLELKYLSPFTQKVLEAIIQIPFGETRSYKELAEMIGHPSAVRAVGSACGRNPYPLFIPCHRVVGSRGIGGFALDLEIKKRLLDFEDRAYQREKLLPSD